MRRQIIVVAAASVISLGLAGCESVPYGNSPAYEPMNGIEGQWFGTDRVAVSEFDHGTFTSRAMDTGNVLAEGSYRYSDQTDVEVTFTSLIRHRTIRANCALVRRDQMNCTASSGANFQLMRRRPA
jgi:hypothetical protein